MARFFVDRPIVAIVIAIVTVVLGLVSMTLSVTFDVESDVNTDQVNAQNRVSQAQPNLPVDVNQFGLTYRSTVGLPLVVVSLYSPNGSYDSLFLGNYSLINVNDALYRVSGVGQIVNFGIAEYAMRVWVKPDKLAKLGLTVPDLVRALQQQSAVNPAGRVGGEPAPPGQQLTYTVRAKGRLITAEEFGDVVVRLTPEGSVVRLKDVSRIELGALSYNQSGRYNGRPGALIAVFQAPGANALAVANAVKAQMRELKERFPSDLDYAIGLDTTLPVTEGIKEIATTLVEAMILVILVVFLFLQNWRATLIPLIAVPVSLIGTFAVFPMLGFSINTLSLFGLVLAIGLVVDDAIVVVEAVEQHIERGLAPRAATAQAMREVSGPVVAIALILSSVFLPVAFMGGIQGRLNNQFAVTIVVSMLISAFNALTLSPALAALLLRPRQEARGLLGRFFGGFNRRFEQVMRWYVDGSHVLIRKAVVGMLILGGFYLVDGLIGRTLPTSFLPEEDYGYFFMNVQLPAAASLERTDQVLKKIEGMLSTTEGVQAYSTIGGFSVLTRISSSYQGFFFVGLKPWDERAAPQVTARAIVDRLNQELAAQVPEAVALAFMPPAIPGLGNAGGFSLWLQDRSGGSVDFLDQQLQKFLAACRQRPELAGVAAPFSASAPQIYAAVDRDKVLKQGVAVADV